MSPLKNTILFLFFLIYPAAVLGSVGNVDSLLQVLDKVVSGRASYTKAKEDRIAELKMQKSRSKALEERYNLNREIISEYQTFICDSAEHYIHENIAIAGTLNNDIFLLESKLTLSYIYSLSGLFLQASELMNSLDYDKLPEHCKVGYCWNSIRYYENLIIYTHDASFSKMYEEKKEDYRDKVMALLYDQSDEYKKECAFKMQQAGRFDEAIGLLLPIFEKQEPGSHRYAMSAMSLAKVYKLAGKPKEEEFYLILAAITDLQLAVKENEALLSLAIKLSENGDVNRSYNYIKVALDDALFYNARFKNSVIARVQPIIEDTYLHKIGQQQQNLRLYAGLTSLFVIVLAIALYFYYRQVKAVSKARKELRLMNDKLLRLNQKLDEANLVKERYIGYFMNQCAVYINKLYEYRKNVNRKIKTGQIDSIYNSSTSALEKDVEELRSNFDKAFLKLYPNFVEEFNSLLRKEERYEPGEGQLNTELRIFALIRLGITDVSQIAVFLRYSIQTVYNYKSKVKGKSIIDSELFEEEVKKIGSLR